MINLAFCEEVGKEPDKEYKEHSMLRLDRHYIEN